MNRALDSPYCAFFGGVDFLSAFVLLMFERTLEREVLGTVFWVWGLGCGIYKVFFRTLFPHPSPAGKNAITTGQEAGAAAPIGLANTFRNSCTRPLCTRDSRVSLFNPCRATHQHLNPAIPGTTDLHNPFARPCPLSSRQMWPGACTLIVSRSSRFPSS